MRQWSIGWPRVAVLALAASAAWAQPQELSVEARHDAFLRTIDSEAGRPRNERLEVLGRTYDGLFPMRSFHDLGQVDDRELDLVFRAALNAVRLVGRPSYVRQAELAFDELESRKLASAKEVAYMQGVYVQMRMLDEARRFHAQHPSADLEPIPLVRKPEDLHPGQPTELAVSPDGQELVHRSVDISGPVQIVVVAHPRCHFSRNATLAIESDPVLSDAFRGSSKWVIPPGLRLEVDAVQRWNREHPATSLTLAYKVDEWPQLDYWGTPTFYFFQNGALAAKVTGWPEGGRREELVTALRQVGLLPPGD